MAVASMIGERTIPKNGYSTPAAIGTAFHYGNRIRDYHWSKLLEKVGLPYQRLYDTRTSFASMMLSSG